METQSRPSGLGCSSKHGKHTGGIPSPDGKDANGGFHARQRHSKSEEFGRSSEMQQYVILSDVNIVSVFVVKISFTVSCHARDVGELGMFVG